jgi:hypothetical protein
LTSPARGLIFIVSRRRSAACAAASKIWDAPVSAGLQTRAVQTVRGSGLQARPRSADDERRISRSRGIDSRDGCPTGGGPFGALFRGAAAISIVSGSRLAAWPTAPMGELRGLMELHESATLTGVLRLGSEARVTGLSGRAGSMAYPSLGPVRCGAIHGGGVLWYLARRPPLTLRQMAQSPLRSVRPSRDGRG